MFNTKKKKYINSLFVKSTKSVFKLTSRFYAEFRFITGRQYTRYIRANKMNFCFHLWGGRGVENNAFDSLILAFKNPSIYKSYKFRLHFDNG